MFSKRHQITTIFINIFQNNFISLVKLPVNMPVSVPSSSPFPHSRLRFQFPRLLRFPTPASALLRFNPRSRPWSGFAPPRDWLLVLATSKSSVFSSSSPRDHPCNRCRQGEMAAGQNLRIRLPTAGVPKRIRLPVLSAFLTFSCPTASAPASCSTECPHGRGEKRTREWLQSSAATGLALYQTRSCTTFCLYCRRRRPFGRPC